MDIHERKHQILYNDRNGLMVGGGGITSTASNAQHGISWISSWFGYHRQHSFQLFHISTRIPMSVITSSLLLLLFPQMI